MSINDLVEKIKPFYILILCIVIASIFFAVGRLSIIEENHSPIRITEPERGEITSVIRAISGAKEESLPAINNSLSSTGTTTQSGEVIGSKSGKKYYFPWCSTLKRVKPENQIKFASIDLAKQAGFTPGGNCKGLK